MLKFTSLCTLALLATALLSAADVTGSWSGTIDIKDEGSGTTITTAVKLQLTQQEGKLTGNIGRPEDAEVVTIKNATMDGNKLEFEATNGETSQPCKFTLVMDGDRMEGDMVTSLDSETLRGKVRIARKKT